jgi:uncharacterized protein YbjT (DUF2867 family)
MSQKTALIFGGTGLVGTSLTEELIKSELYSRILVFTRRNTDNRSNKVSNIVVDFDNPGSFAGEIIGDDMFICLGTTIKKAGTIKNMEKIDRDLPVSLATAAVNNGVKRISVVSSIGANSAASNYYLRIKGEMEKAMLDLNFETVAIVRPSLLLGNRNEKRFGESASKIFMKVFGIFLTGRFRKFRAIEAIDVARAMIWILNSRQGKGIFESDILQDLATQK